MPDRFHSEEVVMHLLTRLKGLWELNLLRPGVKLLRGLITLTVIAAGLGWSWLVVFRLGKASGSLGILILLGIGALLLWILYAWWMLLPDGFSWMLNLEKHSRRTCEPIESSAWRYPVLELAAVVLRLIGVVWVVIAVLVLVDAFILNLGLSGEKLAALWIPPGPGWRILVFGTCLFCLAKGGHRVWKELLSDGLGGVRLPSLGWLATGTWGLVVYSEKKLVVLSGLVVLGWTTAMIVAAVRLIRSKGARSGDNAVATCVVTVGLLVLFFRGELLQIGPWAVTELLVDSLDLRPQWEEFRRVLGWCIDAGLLTGGWPRLMAIFMALGCVAAGLVAWLKSDALRALLGFERNVRREDAIKAPPPTYLRLVRGLAVGSALAAVAGLVAFWFSGDVLGNALANLSERASFSHSRWDRAVKEMFDSTLVDGLRRTVLENWLPASRELLVGRLGFVLLWVFGLYEVVKLSFTVERSTRPVSDINRPLSFFSLRIVSRAQYLVGAILALLSARVIWWAGRSLGRSAELGFSSSVALGIAAAAVATIVFLGMTVLVVLLQNGIKTEVNTRPDQEGVVSARSGYPGLSTVATYGKFVAYGVSFGVPALVLVSALLSNAHGKGLLVPLLVLTAVAFVAFLVLSFFPDVARLLLTLDRNFWWAADEELLDTSARPADVRGGRPRLFCRSAEH